MQGPAVQWWQTLGERVRLADLLDMLVIALVLYGLGLALRRSRSRLMLAFAAGAGALYLAAHTLGLYFTTRLFEAGFVLFTVALLIAFQEELRRSLFRLSAWRPFERRIIPRSLAIEAVVKSVTVMSERSIGALIVISAREPLEAHLTGGHPLDAVATDALIRSLFNPTSPGHDGALIIRGERAERFAVHLPLAREIEAAEHLGTRHAAALGLSERTDALVIAVSEERGVVSIAEHGQLIRGVSPAELRQRLEALSAKLAPEREQRHYYPRFLARLPLQLAAAALAFIIWWQLGLTGEVVQQTLELPVEYRNLPEQLHLEDPLLTSARVTLRGKEAVFTQLDRDSLRLSIDLSGMKPGSERRALGADNLELARGLLVLEVDPPAVALRAEPLRSVTLPVLPVTRGLPPTELGPVELSVRPPNLSVLLPASLARRVDRLETAPVDITSARASTSAFETQVILPRGARLANGQRTEVRVELRPRKTMSPSKPRSR